MSEITEHVKKWLKVWKAKVWYIALSFIVCFYFMPSWGLLKYIENICFIMCHQHQTRSGTIKTTNSGQNTSLFCKNWTTANLTATPCKLFYIIFVDIFFWNH